jgi:hypothetical protein
VTQGSIGTGGDEGEWREIKGPKASERKKRRNIEPKAIAN